MSWPKEGSRDIGGEGTIVSVPMDWCKSPTAIVPYKIWARQIDAADLANTIHQTDDRSHAKNSIVRQCFGDEPGVGGGVISGTHNAECTPKTWSTGVYFEDRNAVRHTDERWMNHKNTYGVLDYRKDMSSLELENAKTIDPKMELQTSARQIPAGAEAFEASAVGIPAPAVAGGAAAAGAELSPGAVVGGAGAAGIELGPLDFVVIAGAIILLYVGTRTSQKPDKCPCVVASYLALKYVCGKACKGGQAHHIVPDYTMRYGSRIEGQLGQKRIKGLPSFYGGASICLKGNAKDDDTQHYQAHQADKDARDLGLNHPSSKEYPSGTAPIGEIARLTRKQAQDTRPECAAQIKAGVDAEFADSDMNTLGRTYFDSRYPPSPDTIPALSKPTIHP